MRRLGRLHSHLLQLQPRGMRHDMSTCCRRWMTSLCGKEDRYRGVHVDLAALPSSCSPQAFQTLLRDSVSEWKDQGCMAVWLEVPINSSTLIPTAASEGFKFHHAEGDHSVLCQWLRPDLYNKLPSFATHQVGVAGCVLREDTHEVIVVKDKDSEHSSWKFPGGLSEIAEDIGETAEREVFEETGVKTECQGILTFRQQHRHPGAFGRSDLFFVCHMEPLTFDLHPCAIEIDECRWIGLDELERQTQLSTLTLRVLQLVRQGLRVGFENVMLTPQSCKSAFRDNTFKMYNAPVTTKRMMGEVEPKRIMGEADTA